MGLRLATVIVLIVACSGLYLTGQTFGLGSQVGVTLAAPAVTCGGNVDSTVTSAATAAAQSTADPTSYLGAVTGLQSAWQSAATTTALAAKSNTTSANSTSTAFAQATGTTYASTATASVKTATAAVTAVATGGRAAAKSAIVSTATALTLLANAQKTALATGAKAVATTFALQTATAVANQKALYAWDVSAAKTAVKAASNAAVATTTSVAQVTALANLSGKAQSTAVVKASVTAAAKQTATANAPATPAAVKLNPIDTYTGTTSDCMVTLTAAGSGTAPVAQWQVNEQDGLGWRDITSSLLTFPHAPSTYLYTLAGDAANTISFTGTAGLMDGYQYRALLTNDAGGAVTNVATLHFPPTITGLSKSTGTASGSDTVVITGTGFLNVLAVNFATVAATYQISSTTALTVTTPAAIPPPATGVALAVSVTTKNGLATENGAWTWTAPVVPATATPSGPTATPGGPTSTPVPGNSATALAIQVSANQVYGQATMTSGVCDAGLAGTSCNKTSASALEYPNGVAVDGGGSLYVSDKGNGRLLYFPSTGLKNLAATTATTVYNRSDYLWHSDGGIAAGGIALDGKGGFYESNANQVSYFAPGSANGSGPAATTSTVTYCYLVPGYIGQCGTPGWLSGYPADATGFSGAAGMAVDGSGGLYVADTTLGPDTPGLNRVLYFPYDNVLGYVDSTATAVYGQSSMSDHWCDAGLGSASSYSDGRTNCDKVTAAGLNNPGSVAVDGHGGLYVADSGNNRVLYYPPSGNGTGAAATTPTIVYGQDADGTDMTDSVPGTSATSLNGPSGLAVDGKGGLYVADSGNNRVLYFPPASGHNYAATTATIVYGQTDMVSSSTGTSATALNSPDSVAIDGNGGIYVADNANNRVVHFPAVISPAPLPTATATSNATSTPWTCTSNCYARSAAIRVYGQSDYVQRSAGTLDNPEGLAVDPKTGGLYVADFLHSQVLYYSSGSTTSSATFSAYAAEASGDTSAIR